MSCGQKRKTIEQTQADLIEKLQKEVGTLNRQLDHAHDSKARAWAREKQARQDVVQANGERWTFEKQAAKLRGKLKDSTDASAQRERFTLATERIASATENIVEVLLGG